MGIAIEAESLKTEVYPQQVGPLVTNLDPDRAQFACFGLVPHWAEPKLARMTYNARTETVASKPSFRSAWKNAQLGLVPMQAFFEPSYETGKAVRHRIARRDGAVFWVAALWERRMEDAGPTRWSFSLLTINAAQHPLMQLMHGPEDEKRSIVIVPDDQRMEWLHARVPEQWQVLLRMFEADDFVDVKVGKLA